MHVSLAWPPADSRRASLFPPACGRRGPASKDAGVLRERELAAKRADGRLAVEEALHVDDLSSDDEAPGNTIGRVPLRW